MSKQKTSYGFRTLLYSPLGAIVVVLVSIGVLHATYTMYVRSREVLVLESSLHTEKTMLAVDKDRLTARVGELETKSGLEALYRERFPVKKPGESVVVILAEDNKPSSTPITPTIWEKIINMFGF